MTSRQPKILNIAHRGARAYAPENTLVAFAKAKTMGCDMFEVDVRVSKDGVVVVHHDENLLRCTDVQRQFPNRENYDLADFNYQEINQLDAGGWYVEQLDLPTNERQTFLQSLTDAELDAYLAPTDRNKYNSGSIRIPTLSDTLSLAKELGLMVNIELKPHDETNKVLVNQVTNAIINMGLTDKVLISSFNHGLLRQVRAKSKAIATAILCDNPIKAPVTYLRKVGANAYNLGCYWDFKEKGYDSKPGQRYLKHLHKVCTVGFAANIWTCNNSDEMLGLLMAGATGLISDYPNRVNKAILAYAKTTNSSI